MGRYEIPRFFYTRFDKSPRGKSGFQVGYWSKSLIPEKSLVDIEEVIYWPQTLELKEKLTIAPITLKDTDYLIVAFYEVLSEARDKYGRGGLFQVHGFLLPAEALEKPINLLSFYKEVRERFHDKVSESGDLPPLELSLEPVEEIPDYSFNLGGKTLPQLVALLREALISEEKVFVKLPHTRIGPSLALIQNLLLWLEPSLRKKFSVDTAFDGGNSFYSRVNLLGYIDLPPKGSSALNFSLKSLSLDGAEGEDLKVPASKSTSSYDPYSKFLEALSTRKLKEIRTYAILEKTMLLSSFLSGIIRGENPDPTLTPNDMKDIPPLFFKVNQPLKGDLVDPLLRKLKDLLNYGGEVSSLRNFVSKLSLQEISTALLLRKGDETNLCDFLKLLVTRILLEEEQLIRKSYEMFWEALSHLSALASPLNCEKKLLNLLRSLTKGNYEDLENILLNISSSDLLELYLKLPLIWSIKLLSEGEKSFEKLSETLRKTLEKLAERFPSDLRASLEKQRGVIVDLLSLSSDEDLRIAFEKIVNLEGVNLMIPKLRFIIRRTPLKFLEDALLKINP